MFWECRKVAGQGLHHQLEIDNKGMKTKEAESSDSTGEKTSFAGAFLGGLHL
jgi:hypothetical protein